tara:strand:- start:213 stop:581 length:369 start_codon:yes stop_codon:yes gene_type:complete
MKKATTPMPGLEAIQARFITLLQDRYIQIAQHALDAWEAVSPAEARSNLAGAQAILHQIAGTAGSLGFAELGHKARACEVAIIGHLEKPDTESGDCPDELITQIDTFVYDCRELIEAQRCVA